MDKGYISENEIISKVQELNNLISDFIDDVSIYTSYANNMQEFLIGLSMCLNTAGGMERLKKMQNIDLNVTSLNNIANLLGETSVDYKKVSK